MILDLHKEVLIDALDHAGEIQRESFNQETSYRVKGDQSNIVTEVDYESEKVIIQKIQTSFKDHNIISEECGFKNNFSEFTWVIDPLDGTSNFAAGIPWFGILISLHYLNSPLLAGAYLPIQNMLYFAEKGKGSYLNENRISVSKEKISNTLIAFSTDYTADENYLNKGLKAYKYLVQKSRNVRTTNSILDFIYVAEGKFGGAINLHTKIWDISAPYLIVKEAGGKFLNLDGSKIDFTISDDSIIRNFPVLSATPKIYDQIKPILMT